MGVGRGGRVGRNKRDLSLVEKRYENLRVKNAGCNEDIAVESAEL
jgi:hypothetical protein